MTRGGHSLCGLQKRGFGILTICSMADRRHVTEQVGYGNTNTTTNLLGRQITDITDSSIKYTVCLDRTVVKDFSVTLVQGNSENVIRFCQC